MGEERNIEIEVPIASTSNGKQPRKTLHIPKECSGCGMDNFNIWGTVIDETLRIEVRCMRCGKTNGTLETTVPFQK